MNLHIIRQLTWRMEEWTKAFAEGGAALITISREDKELRIRTRE